MQSKKLYVSMDVIIFSENHVVYEDINTVAFGSVAPELQEYIYSNYLNSMHQAKPNGAGHRIVQNFHREAAWNRGQASAVRFALFMGAVTIN